MCHKTFPKPEPSKKTKARKDYQENKYLTSQEQEVLSRSQGMCENPDCTEEISSCHHIIPRGQGGSDCRTNLIGLCCDCHDKALGKGKMEVHHKHWMLRVLRKWKASWLKHTSHFPFPCITGLNEMEKRYGHLYQN